MKLKAIRNLIIILTLIVISYGTGFRMGEKNINTNLPSPIYSDGSQSDNKVNIDLSLFWDVWGRLNRFYIDKKAIDPQKMVYGAISGMVASLGDPYTVFLPPSQNKDAKDDLGGKFEGIGVQLGIKDKKIVVVAPLKGTPAEKAGIKAGDTILKVDGKEVYNLPLPEVVAKIRGTKGSSVNLTVYRNESSSSADFKVNRDTINVASVEEEDLSVKCTNNACEKSKETCTTCDKIFYLKLSRFGDHTNDEWEKTVATIVEKYNQNSGKYKGLIFDLRNNPGGYLSGSVFIASEFLKDGTVVIQDSVKTGKSTYTVDRKGKLLEIPMVVLINRGTASASEIVAGALSERGRAKLVGEVSFGKGSVQEAQDLTGGSGIHITIAKWLLPSGKWIHTVGVDPDFKVVNDENNPDSDAQLNKAIELLMKNK
jgi:carboxyl-terminal processing protease